MNKLLKHLVNNRASGAGVKIEASTTEANVYVYDAIGYWGIEAEDFVKGINSLKVNTINLRINSPGGDVFAARAMKTALEAHQARVIVHIDGIAASAASFLMLAGDEIKMADGAFLMIHNPWGFAMGDATEMRSTAELLDKVTTALVNDYVHATGQSDAQIRDWMTAETWFTAKEAVDSGFIHAVTERKHAENRFDLSAFRHPPDALSSVAESPEEPFSALENDRDRMLARLALFECAA
jgi:Protease subunit of ATP-dependent Clp proteases